MSLKTRLARLERAVEWLGTEGELRWIEAGLAFFDKKKQLEDYLADHPDKAAELAAHGFTCLTPTPRPQPPPKVEAPPVPRPAPPSAPRSTPAAPPKADVIQPATPLPKPPPAPQPQPPPVEETHEIPEHMQIRPIRWVPVEERWTSHEVHKPEDEDYDPFAEFDED
jgi:hypothetical protein